MSVSNWSTTAGDNNSAPPDGAPEGMLASEVNNTIRQNMASVRELAEDGGWFDWGHTTTFASATSFTVSTDLTAVYSSGRRARAVGSTTGTIYGNITTSSFASPTTTVTVVWDSGSLQNEALTISVGLITEALTDFFPESADETAEGVTIVDPQYPGGDPYIDPRRYGAATTSTDNVTALQAALDVANQGGGGIVRLPSGTFAYQGSTTLTIYANTRLEGVGITETVIRYTGISFIDVLTVDAALSSDVGVQVRDIQLAGGVFQAGKARYSFYATTFGRGCQLRNVWLREGLGTLKIVTGTYSSLENIIAGPVVPLESDSGATSTQYNTMYDATNGSFYFNGNSSSICGLKLQTLVTDNDNGGSTPENAIFLKGSPATLDDISIESIAASVAPNTIVTLDGGKFDFRGLYSENINFNTSYVLIQNASLLGGDDINFLTIDGPTLIENQGTGTPLFRNYTFYDMDVNRVYNVPNSGINAGNGVDFENGNWSSGARVTDAAVNADDNNVNDTDGETYPLGATNGSFRRANDGPQMYPRKISGLTVTASSDGSGHYVQITGGVFMTERGKYISVKRQTEADSTNLVVYRLRPTTASKFYEVYVNDAGGIYLVQNDSDTTTWRGDKIAEFDTDGSTQITNLSDNPLLSVKGQYTPGTDSVIFYVNSIPTATDKRYHEGDMAIHKDCATAEVAFWIYDGGAWLAGPNMA